MGQPGFVYVLSNPAMPGLLKIGMTTKSPVTRAEELSTTGVPAPFEVEFAIYVPDAAEMERDIHDRFSRLRFRAGREFFKAEPSEVAVSIVERIPLFDGHCVVANEEAGVFTEICHELNKAAHRDMHYMEALSALALLTPDELKNLALRYDAHCDQQRAAADSEAAT